MTTIELNNLNIGDFVFVVINTGSAGICKYQYIGVFTCHADKTDKHVFLSEYFLSTTLVTKGIENRSRTIKCIFNTEIEAKNYKNFLINTNGEEPK